MDATTNATRIATINATKKTSAESQSIVDATTDDTFDDSGLIYTQKDKEIKNNNDESTRNQLPRRLKIDYENEPIVEPVVESTTADTPDEASLIYSRKDKELKNKSIIDVLPTIIDDDMSNDRIAVTNGKEVVVVTNVNNAKATKYKKSSKTSSTKKKSIDPTNPCSSCPALKERDKRFVDGEGSGESGVVHI